MRLAALKGRGGVLHQLPPPGVDHGGMHPKLLGQLGHRLIPLQGRQGHLRLEFRLVLLAFAFHLPTPFQKPRA